MGGSTEFLDLTSLFEKFRTEIVSDDLEKFYDFTTVSRNRILTVSWFGQTYFSISPMFREISCWQFSGLTDNISRCQQSFEKIHNDLLLICSKKFFCSTPGIMKSATCKCTYTVINQIWLEFDTSFVPIQYLFLLFFYLIHFMFILKTYCRYPCLDCK